MCVKEGVGFTLVPVPQALALPRLASCGYLACGARQIGVSGAVPQGGAADRPPCAALGASNFVCGKVPGARCTPRAVCCTRGRWEGGAGGLVPPLRRTPAIHFPCGEAKVTLALESLLLVCVGLASCCQKCVGDHLSGWRVKLW